MAHEAAAARPPPPANSARMLTEACADLGAGGSSGSSVRYFQIAGGRRAHILDLVQSYLEVLTGDAGNDSVELNVAINEYASALAPFAVPLILGIVFALIVCPILWIGRCCAHRCWSPRYGKASTRKQRSALGCYLCLWVAVAIAIVLGSLAGVEIASEARRTACAIDGAIDSLAGLVGNTSTSIASIDDTSALISTDVTLAVDQVASLTTLLADGGTLSESCSAIRGAQASASAIDAIVATVSGAQSPSSFTQVQSQLTSAESSACELSGFAGEMTAASTQLASISASLGGNDFGSMRQSLTGVANDIDSLSTSFGDVAHPMLWDQFGPLMDLSGLLVLSVAVICLLLSLLGALCLGSRHKAGTCCTTNNIGVQAVGCSWVTASILVILYFLLSGVLLPASAVVADAVFVLQRLPQEPESILPTSFCNRSIGVGSVSMCDMLSCGGAGSSLADLALAQVGSGIGEAIFNEHAASIQSSRTIKGARLADVQASSDQLAGASTNLASLSASSFNVPSGAAATAVDGELAFLVGNVTLASTAISSAIAPLTSLSTTLGSLHDHVSSLSSAVADLIAGTPCTFSEMWDSILQPIRLMFEVGVSGLAFATCLTALLLAMWIVPSILLQIRYGDVGREPGCPRGLRCCCCVKAHGPARAVKVDAKNAVMVESSTTVGV